MDATDHKQAEIERSMQALGSIVDTVGELSHTLVLRLESVTSDGESISKGAARGESNSVKLWSRIDDQRDILGNIAEKLSNLVDRLELPILLCDDEKSAT